MAILTFDSTAELMHFICPLGEHTSLNPLSCNFPNNLDFRISYSLSHQNNFTLYLHVTVACYLEFR